MNKIKSLVWFLLVLCIFTIGTELMAEEDYSGGPIIKDFEVVKDGEELMLSFSFYNVEGGLGKAIFTVGYIIERRKTAIETNVVTDLSIVPDLSFSKELGIFETGKFQAIISWPKDQGIESGDKIKYFICLKDSSGKKSNTVLYEYEVIEEWEI